MIKEHGITLVSLVIYIIVMLIVLVVISTIINQFYKNTNSIEADTEEILEFNKFNTYFLKEVKTKGNTVDAISDNCILFKTGNSFSLSSNRIYYNNIEICKGVKSLLIKQGKNGDGIDKNIIYVTLSFENFENSINYKIEEIY